MRKTYDFSHDKRTLINLYLRDCAAKGRRPDLSWSSADQAAEADAVAAETIRQARRQARKAGLTRSAVSKAVAEEKRRK